jgi:hypothetical protein
MIFRLFRDSGLPILLEEDEAHTIKTLEAQGRWSELDNYYEELKNQDGLKEITIEANTIEELKFFLTTIDDTFEFRINFEKKYVAIMDGGRDH